MSTQLSALRSVHPLPNDRNEIYKSKMANHNPGGLITLQWTAQTNRRRPVHRGITVGQTPLIQTRVLDLPPSAKKVPCEQLRVITAACVDHMIESTFNVSPSASCRTFGTHAIGTISETFPTTISAAVAAVLLITVQLPG